MLFDEDSELFFVARRSDTKEKGLPFALEAIRLVSTDPQQALTLAKQAEYAAPYAWGEWTKAFTFEVGKGA